MQKELKDAIIKAVQQSQNEFQQTNWIMGNFKEYIYDKDGNYLIGGEEVAEFIENFIKLYTN